MTGKEILEMAFREWLHLYETTETERWWRLTSAERDTLTLQQWHVFLCEYHNAMANFPETPESEATSEDK